MKIQLEIVNDIRRAYSPVLRLKIEQIKGEMQSSQMQEYLHLAIAFDYHNPINSTWEPIVEKALFELKRKQSMNKSHSYDYFITLRQDD